ncbi:hypothetical protein FRC15_007339 [Serendipita sp. 397]|nr:hypothetical protein FRC15_007339 [Serendipita sp. 397]
MAEAIGLGLSIFALVKLGAVVLNTCYDYVAKAKNAPEDIQRIISEVGSLQTILEQLQRLTSDPDEEKMTLLKSLEGPNGPFKACYDVLDEIQKKLQSIKDVASLRRRLLFPFEGPKLNELLHTLEKHKTSFILAIAGDNVKATSNVEKKVDNVSNRLEDMKALEYRKEVLQWLKGADPTTNHNTARKKHEPGTGEWLLDSKEFKSWMEEDGKIMWLNGIPGAGKTVLSSTVIENLILHCKTRTGDRVAYYYFDFSDHGKQTTSGCLQSLIRQLCEQSDTIPVAVKELHADCKSTTPSLSQLTSTLIGIMNYGPKYFIAIDALDECKEEEEEHERESFFEALQEIISSTTGRYSVFIASRPEIDISRNLTELGALNFNIQRNLVDADIRSHVRACLEKEIRFKKWPIPVKAQVEDKLTAGANGMFRWAVCQLDSLKRCLKPANALRELETLPKTLEETYSRILKRVPSVYEREMKSILLLLAFSARPMTIQEVAEATAVNLENRSFSTDERFPDAYDILELCSSLVSLVDLGSDSASILRKERMNVFNWPPETKIIHFAHFSVKEYIISERARKMVSPSLVITPSTSQLHIAEMCLIYLLDFNGGKATTNFDHSEYPLLAYAALHWMTHLASMEEADLAAIEDLLLRLFDPDDSANLMNCLNLYDPVSRYTLRQYGDQTRTLGFTVHRNKQDFETPLYYACYYGLLPIVEALLGKLATRRRSAEELGTALEAAASGGYVAIVRRLLEEGADPNAPYCRKFHRPLHAGASSGSVEIVELLLVAGADVNASGGEFGTALHVAARHGSSEIIQLLIDNGHDVNPWVQMYGTALTLAARHGHDEGEYGTALQAATAGKNESIVLLLLEFGAKVNLPCCGKFGNPLQAAARMGKMSLVQLLIDRGADVNARGGRYETALQAAAAKGDETIVRLLLSKKADVNIVGGDYQTALRAAAAEGHEGIVKLLLAAGADINITTVGEHTSASDPYSITSFRSTLEVAVASGNIAIVQLLLDHGMDINASEESCSASLSHAAALPTTTMLEFLIDQGANVKLYGGMATFTAANRRKIDPLKLLIRHGANINYCTQHSGSALQECAHMGHREIMELLLESGADVNAQGGFYGTALQRAIESGKKEISMELLRRGADVNAKAGKWGTALSMAARKGDEEMVRELLQRGADVNLTHGYHSNALQAAIDGDYYEMANELLDKGADPSVPGVHGTALISACGYGKVGQIQLVKRILSYGVDIEAVDPARPEDSATPGTRFYVTALQYAAYAGNEAVARLLIEAGANVNMKAGTWGYALQVAAKRGHHEVVTLLLENGADINAVGGEFGTALQAAANEGNDTVVSLLLENGADVNIEAGLYGSPLQAVSRLGKLRHVQLFLERGAKINTTVGHYGAPLHAAAKRGNDGVVKLLLEHGADVNLVCGKHGSALQAACCGHSGRTENIRTIELLLKHGANVNQEGGKWGTALQAAAYHHYFYVEILLRHGADPNLKGGRFGSPLEAARKKGLPRVARLLIQHGAREDT